MQNYLYIFFNILNILCFSFLFFKLKLSKHKNKAWKLFQALVI